MPNSSSKFMRPKPTDCWSAGGPCSGLACVKIWTEIIAGLMILLASNIASYHLYMQLYRDPVIHDRGGVGGRPHLMYKVSLDPAIFGSLNKWSTSIKVTGKASKKGRFKDTLYIE